MQRVPLVASFLGAWALLASIGCGSSNTSPDECEVCPANCPTSGGLCSKQDGLVANYGFEEFSGGTVSVPRRDATQCAHDLSDPFFVMSTTTSHGGQFAARFRYTAPGVRNCLLREDSPDFSVFHSGHSYSIAAWFQILPSQSAYGKIIIKGADDPNARDPIREFGFEYQHCPRPEGCVGHPITTNHLHWVLFDSLEHTSVHVEVPPADFDPEANLGRWEFVVMGHDDANQIAFLQLNNGKLYSESTAGLTIRDTDAPLLLGGFIAPFDGILDDVMIWNRALTATERTSVFERGLVCP